MGSNLHELSLDYKPKNKTMNSVLREISVTGNNVSEKLQKIDEYVNKLEDEMRKIDAFKRELPFCMLLLNDAIVALKDEITNVREEDEKVKSEKKNWMSSAKLWSSSSSSNITGGGCSNIDNDYRKLVQITREVIDENPFSLFGISGLSSIMKKEEKVIQAVPLVSIMNPGIISTVHNGVSNTMFWSSKSNSGAIFSASSGTNNVQPNLQRQQHPFQRKQRRCWSPELHRRFVSALQQLGGSQVATPKQIRELMHVDGLTNDEKYRLHVNRVPCVSSTLGSHSVVIIGDSWVAQDQYENGDFKSSDLQSGSPQGPLNLEGGNCGISLTTGGNNTDDEGDRKSENYNAEDRGLADQQ
ncbi:hypothetical protein C5167_014042 [Papaver somniferum]|uniref:HHO5-like N-terminal domain-containing protein n=1 Tax=Papaver somniferum TaxID=3469 RepID=A0A4Y7J5H8_PAPSO|nr:hypothetical protein C5167_014042 [Papaver somniferum]